MTSLLTKLNAARDNAVAVDRNAGVNPTDDHLLNVIASWGRFRGVVDMTAERDGYGIVLKAEINGKLYRFRCESNDSKTVGKTIEMLAFDILSDLTARGSK